MLREQLEQAGLANEALSQDIRRLTTDWTKAREELDQKETDWRREEEVGKCKCVIIVSAGFLVGGAETVSLIIGLSSHPVLPQLLQQRAQSPAAAMATGGWLPKARL